jgi:hypothetical protein
MVWVWAKPIPAQEAKKAYSQMTWASFFKAEDGRDGREEGVIS